MEKIIINVINSDNSVLDAEIVLCFEYKKNKYLLYSLESLGINIYKEYQKKENRDVYLAQIFEEDNNINLKGLYSDEINSIFEFLLLLLSDTQDKNNAVNFINVQNIIKDKKVKEYLCFEPSKVSICLYYLVGLQKIYGDEIRKSGPNYELESLEELLKKAKAEIEELTFICKQSIELSRTKGLHLVNDEISKIC